MEKLFTVSTKHPSDIIYEDRSCIVKMVEADFSDYSCMLVRMKL